ncbi:MAG TPA: deoxyhypusine synthase [Acidobacteriota bacterium]|nr:deoxyhypusine synthase [Acidobacteriota bacterium]
MKGKKNGFLKGRAINPIPVERGMTATRLVDEVLLAYNGARLQEACRLFAERILQEDVTVAVSLAGALTPAGLGISCLIPLMETGRIDWIVSTGANLYHDAHFGIGLDLYRGTPACSDIELRRQGIVRIYDIFFDYEVLLSTDQFFRRVLRRPEFQCTMGTAEFHYRIGRYLDERERAVGRRGSSLLAAAYRAGVPVYTSSPGDSSIGMNVAALALEGSAIRLDPTRDVNETAALVYGAKRSGGKSAVVIFGGGSPKNFLLQTEPQIQEVLGIAERGHDYFIQFTDARPDTGGLSGATPSEAVSWGKIDPDQLPHTVVCYLDCTVAMPLFTAYAMDKTSPRPLKRLYDRREVLLGLLSDEYAKVRAGSSGELE